MSARPARAHGAAREGDLGRRRPAVRAAPGAAGRGGQRRRTPIRRIRVLVEAAGCEPVFLPAPSPDHSPIEEASGKLEALIRAGAARPRTAPAQAIAAAPNAITAADATGRFAHAGYL